MIDLEILGMHPDGNQIVLTDPDGARYLLPVTDQLRSLTRKPRPALKSVDNASGRTPKPRQIQALMREGATAKEISERFGLEMQQVEAFEAPIRTERKWIVSQALKHHITAESDSPVLLDLVTDRLAVRGVDPDSLNWDAIRTGNDPWELILSFVQAANEIQAHWYWDAETRSLTALDEEAIWLTETASPAGEARGIDSVFPPHPVSTTDFLSSDMDSDVSAAGTEALLEEVNAARGIRSALDIPDDFDEDEIETAGIPATDDSFNAKGAVADNALGQHPGNTRSPEVDSGTETDQIAQVIDFQVDATAGSSQADSAMLPGMDAYTDSDNTQRKHKKGRRSVPSWDEIVFGSRHDRD